MKDQHAKELIAAAKHAAEILRDYLMVNGEIYPELEGTEPYETMRRLESAVAKAEER